MNVTEYYGSGINMGSGRFGDCRPVGSNPCGRRHRGQDISHSSKPGTVPVPALHAGVVVSKTAPSSVHGFGYGITVRSRLGDGNLYDISYSHGPWASQQFVGERIAQGQVILHEGNSGATVGSCVHIEQLRVGGGFLDPLPEIQRVSQGYRTEEDGGGTPAPAPTPSQAPAASPQYHTATVADIQSLPNKRGLQKVAKLYGYKGALDNDFGPGSRAGLQTFLDRNYGGSLAAWLRAKWGYVGNDQWGPVMAAAATRADTANWAAL